MEKLMLMRNLLWAISFLALAVGELRGDQSGQVNKTSSLDASRLNPLENGKGRSLNKRSSTTTGTVVNNEKKRYGGYYRGRGGGGGGFGWGWGGGGGGGGVGGGGGGGGGWGWGGGGGGWYKWGCGRGKGNGRGGRRVHGNRVFSNGDYKLGEFAECMGRGWCKGMRLDCPLHCGGPCFYDCQHMCKAHCRRP